MALLAALAVGVGLLKVRGDRLEPTGLQLSWHGLSPGLQSGIVYAAWCHRVPWRPMLGTKPAVERLRRARIQVLHLLFGLPVGVGVELEDLTRTVAGLAGLRYRSTLIPLVAAGFLEPLAALGAADLDASPPAIASTLRCRPQAVTVIGSALIAAGEEVPLPSTPKN